MADDLRDTFGDDTFLDTGEEEIEEEGEGKQNRTFLIGVALLGGLLLLAIAAFVIWAMVLNPRQADQNAQIIATNEAVLIAMQQTQTVEARPTDMPTATPTQQVEPSPTPTPVIRATQTPTPENTSAGGEAGGAAGTPGAAGTATVSPRRTETPRPATTAAAPTAKTPSATPDTGLGEVLLMVAAGLLVALIVFARRLRRA